MDGIRSKNFLTSTTIFTYYMSLILSSDWYCCLPAIEWILKWNKHYLYLSIFPKLIYNYNDNSIGTAIFSSQSQVAQKNQWNLKYQNKMYAEIF